MATCLTKSAVEGATPSAELTPVFSPIDWASAGAAASRQAAPNGGDNADLKAWAGKTLPALQHHIEMAQTLVKAK